MSKSPKVAKKSASKKDLKKDGKQEENANEVDTVVKYYPAKYFIWEKVHAKFTKTGVLKVRSKKGLKKWSERLVPLSTDMHSLLYISVYLREIRFVGLYLNYLVCFKAGKVCRKYLLLISKGQVRRANR